MSYAEQTRINVLLVDHTSSTSQLLEDSRLFEDSCITLDIVRNFAEISKYSCTKIDVLMFNPPPNGIVSFRQASRLRSRYPISKIAVYRAAIDSNMLRACQHWHVDGVIPSEFNYECLVCALKLVASGHLFYPYEAASALLWSYRGHITPGRSDSRPLVHVPALDELEQRILKAVADGQSNKMIANALNRSEIMVKVRLKAIYRKLGVNNRASAVRCALEFGLFRFDPSDRHEFIRRPNGCRPTDFCGEELPYRPLS